MTRIFTDEIEVRVLAERGRSVSHPQPRYIRVFPCNPWLVRESVHGTAGWRAISWQLSRRRPTAFRFPLSALRFPLSAFR